MTTTKRNVTETNEFINERITLRTYMEDGSFLRADVFVAGQRVGIYKSAAAAQRRIQKEI